MSWISSVCVGCGLVEYSYVTRYMMAICICESICRIQAHVMDQFSLRLSWISSVFLCHGLVQNSCVIKLILTKNGQSYLSVQKRKGKKRVHYNVKIVGAFKDIHTHTHTHTHTHRYRIYSSVRNKLSVID